MFFSMEFWRIMIPMGIAILVWRLNEGSKRKWERWQLKKNTCLNALNIANAVLSNYKYTVNNQPCEITPQHESIENVRSCFNELACICDGNAVLTELKKIVFSNPPVSPDAIVDLRSAVRKELGFGHKIIDIDREKAFIGKMSCTDAGKQ